MGLWWRGEGLLEEQEGFASGATPAQTGVGQRHNRQHSQMVHWLTGGGTIRHQQVVNPLAAGGLSGWEDSVW